MQAEMPVHTQRMQTIRLHRSQNEHPGVPAAQARYANGHNQDVWITIGAVNGRPMRGVAIVLTTIAVPVAASADEFGGSVWLPGQYASFAAEPATPGFSLELVGYTGWGNQTTDSLTRGGHLVSGATNSQQYVFATPGYSFKTPVLGAQLYLGVTVSIGWADSSVSAVQSVFSGRNFLDVGSSGGDTTFGLTDTYPTASLKWAFGADQVHNVMAYVLGNIPTAVFDLNKFSGLGVGHYALDGGLAYTYDAFDKGGPEFSITAGLTYNFITPSTAYQSGIDGHIDVAASYPIAKPFYVGAVGYFYNQLTDDIGAPPELGGYRSRVAGAGPQAGWRFLVGKVAVDVNLRGYAEFAAQNRTQGTNAWLTVSFSPAR
jgi:hypothetical protein